MAQQSRNNSKPNIYNKYLFSGIAAISFLLIPSANDINVFILHIVAALFIQLRLLCNLFDGMVAIEGGKATRSGELFNDIPDRIADPLIFVGLGYAITSPEYESSLGWVAALLSVLTAYIRVLASSADAPVSFAGPMAKQHRMAVVTTAYVISAFEMSLFDTSYTLFTALVVIIIGAIITIWRRTIAAYNYLEKTK